MLVENFVHKNIRSDEKPLNLFMFTYDIIISS